MSEKKIRFAIIGSGWRALYYVRIAQKLPQYFELCAMLCRTEEKKNLMSEKYGIRAVTSEDEVTAFSPDFVVVAVSKTSVARVSFDWLEKGIPVLAETPCALDRNTAEKLEALAAAGKMLVTAEQYFLYPQNIARKKILQSGLIGDPGFLYLSLAHEYHGFSLARYFLDIPADMSYTLQAREYTFPTVETLSRYEAFTDGRVADKKRVVAQIRFENGKVCVYDFDSEQYRSPIRGSHVKVQGVRGELFDDEVRWLDENSAGHKEKIVTESSITEYEDENPNLQKAEEVTRIAFKDEILYTPPFGEAGLTEDETAIAQLLQGMGSYVRGGSAPYPLKDSAADALFAIRLQDALKE